MADPLLRIEALHSGYGDAAVLHGIDLAIAEGSAVALLGRNGAGKSTLLKTILNAGPRVTGGRITLDGRDIRELHPETLRSHIGVVAQETQLFAGSVQDNPRNTHAIWTSLKAGETVCSLE